MRIDQSLEGARLWLFVWSLPALLVSIGYLQQRAQKGGVWGADSSGGSSNGSRGRASAWYKRRAPALASALTLPLVFFLPDYEREMRAVVALASLFYCIKTMEVLLEDRFAHEPLWARIVGINGTFFDIAERKPAKPLLLPRLGEVAEVVTMLAIHAGECYAATWLINHRYLLAAEYQATPLGKIFVVDSRDLSLAVACFASCLYAFFSLHVFGDGLALLWLVVAGIRFPNLMDSPEKSNSVREFWLRWDTVMQKLLRRHVFEPIRGMGGGVPFAAACTFFASGLMHVYPVFVALGNDWHAGGLMMSYFVYQFMAISVEASLGVRKWPWFMAKTWTLIHLFAPSYMLVAPCFKLAGISF